MLKQRIITAVILALILVGVIATDNTIAINLLFAVILYAASRELVALTLGPNPALVNLLPIPLVGVFWWSLSVINPEQLYWQAMYGFVAWILISISLPIYRHSGNWSIASRLALLIFAASLLWVCVHGMLYLHSHFEQGSWMLLYLFTLVWIADIGAYFSGKKFGRNKLAKTISPGKTWEGVVGGVLLNLVWMLVVFSLSQGFGLALLPFLLIGLITSALSVVGDLFESILKREANVKDSGKLLPGHGGILDRIDSVIAATPVFVAGLYLAGLA
jgi:phosphatidate cytidylyltransferase